MNTSTNTAVVGIIAIVETMLLFFVGVLGNKIAEALQISNTSLFVLTAIGIIVLSTISYTKAHPISNVLPGIRPSGTVFIRFIPKTMVSIFPWGVVLGLIIAGITISSIPSQDPMHPPSWIANIFGARDITIPPYEFVGILFGVSICLMFSILVDPYLASSLSMAFGISFSTSIIIIRPSDHIVSLTYITYLLGFLLLVIFIMLAEPILGRMREILTEQRI